MSNRNKSKGQAAFRRQAEQAMAFINHAHSVASVQFGNKPFMRMDVYAPDVAISYKRHHETVRETCLGGEFGTRIAS
jgi:hypothetical protein